MNSNKYLDKACLVCKKKYLRIVHGFSFIPRVTSDCRPFISGGELVVCDYCSLVQKLPSEGWLTEISNIYREYSAYSLAGGEEQLVLDSTSGVLKKRSEIILCNLSKKCNISQKANVGCGHGVTLQEMANKFQDWKLHGYELGCENLDRLRLIDGFCDLYTGSITTINNSFELITMIHSLEHFISPLEILKQLRALLTPDGILFIQVCNVNENPFDLLIADHLTHFSPISLLAALNIAGYSVLESSTNWVNKEISIVAIQNSSNLDSYYLQLNAANQFFEISNSVDWLGRLVSEAKIHADSTKNFGIFGTSIAATWLATALEGRVKFFVDEDPNRIGRNHMGLPVKHPTDVDIGATVYLALAASLCGLIHEKLNHLPIHLVVPSDII